MKKLFPSNLTAFKNKGPKILKRHKKIYIIVYRVFGKIKTVIIETRQYLCTIYF